MAERSFSVPSTITETIYEYLKKAIINGHLKPGQRLQEKEIAAQFQVSTTPVREAFQRLFAQKYIVINARKDVVVSSASREELRDFFEVVRILDALASKKAIYRLTAEDIKELKKMTERLGKFYRQQKITEYVAENLKIHRKIWSACGNKFLYEFLVAMGEKYTFYGNQLIFMTFKEKSEKKPTFMDCSFQDHLDLMQAIENRDAERLEKIILKHWGRDFLDENNEQNVLFLREE